MTVSMPQECLLQLQQLCTADRAYEELERAAKVLEGGAVARWP